MKKLYLLPLLAFFLFSCEYGIEGPPGPQGPPGPAGQDGDDGLIGITLDYENVDFIDPEFEVFIALPEDITVLPSDVILVYRFLYQDPDVGDVWEPLPQLYFTEFGQMQYNYDFSAVDVRLFMDANFDLNLLDAGFTDDQIFRLVIVPSDFLNGRVRKIDYKELESRFDLQPYQP